MHKLKTKHKTGRKIISIILVCLFSMNTVSWEMPLESVCPKPLNNPVSLENLQVWSIVQRVTNDVFSNIGNEYNTPQAKIELGFILDLILEKGDGPFRNINIDLDEWYAKCKAQGIDRVFNMFQPPTKEGDSITFYLELFQGPQKGERFQVALTGKTLSDILKDEKNIKIAKCTVIPAPPSVIPAEAGINNIDSRFHGNDNDGGKIVHTEYLEIKETSEYYSEKMVLHGMSFTSMNAKRAEKFFMGNKLADTAEITVEGKKIKVILDKELKLDADRIKHYVEEAIRYSGGSVENIPDTLVFAVLDKSTHLFEDHIANGFIGVNRAVLDIEDMSLTFKTALLEVGLVHELTHELTGEFGPEFEAKQLKIDAAILVEMLGANDQDMDDLYGILDNILADREFYDALAEEVESYGEKVEKQKSAPQPASVSPVDTFKIKEDSPYYSDMSVKDVKGIDYWPKYLKTFGEILLHNNCAIEGEISSFEVNGKAKKIKVILDKELGLDISDIDDLLGIVLLMLGKTNINPPDTLVIAVLDKSTHLFEDHIANGFIGVNRAVFDIADPEIRESVLLMGLIHELTHELTGQSGEEFEAKQLERDAAYIISRLGVNNLAVYALLVSQLSTILGNNITTFKDEIFRRLEGHKDSLLAPLMSGGQPEDSSGADAQSPQDFHADAALNIKESSPYYDELPVKEINENTSIFPLEETPLYQLGEMLVENECAVQYKIPIRLEIDGVNGAPPYTWDGDFTVYLDKELEIISMTEISQILMMIAEAKDFGDNANLGQNAKNTFVITVLDQSPHLFEVRPDGFIGINRAILEIKDEKIRDALIKMAIFHGFAAAKVGLADQEFEAEQLERDVEFLDSMLSFLIGENILSYGQEILLSTPLKQILANDVLLNKILALHAHDFASVPKQPQDKTAVHNVDEIIKDFETRYETLTAQAAKGDSDAIRALGHAYGALEPVEKTEVYRLLFRKAKHGNNDALYGLGAAYASLTPKKQKDVYLILKIRLDIDYKGAIEGIRYAYIAFTPEQKEEIYHILSTLPAIKGQDITFETLGYIYGLLTPHQKQTVYDVLKTNAGKENKFALTGLGFAYGSLTPKEMTKVSLFLATKATTVDAALYALSYAYESLGSELREEIYAQLIEKAKIESERDVLNVLAYIYELLDADKQKEVYTVLTALKSSTQDLYYLARLYAKVKGINIHPSQDTLTDEEVNKLIEAVDGDSQSDGASGQLSFEEQVELAKKFLAENKLEENRLKVDKDNQTLYLHLINTGITDISALNGLANLVGLFIDATPITDISALGSLANLKELYLVETTITDTQIYELFRDNPNRANLLVINKDGKRITYADVPEEYKVQTKVVPALMPYPFLWQMVEDGMFAGPGRFTLDENVAKLIKEKLEGVNIDELDAQNKVRYYLGLFLYDIKKTKFPNDKFLVAAFENAKAIGNARDQVFAYGSIITALAQAGMTERIVELKVDDKDIVDLAFESAKTTGVNGSQVVNGSQAEIYSYVITTLAQAGMIDRISQLKDGGKNIIILAFGSAKAENCAGLRANAYSSIITALAQAGMAETIVELKVDNKDIVDLAFESAKAVDGILYCGYPYSSIITALAQAKMIGRITELKVGDKDIVDLAFERANANPGLFGAYSSIITALTQAGMIERIAKLKIGDKDIVELAFERAKVEMSGYNAIMYSCIITALVQAGMVERIAKLKVGDKDIVDLAFESARDYSGEGYRVEIYSYIITALVQGGMAERITKLKVGDKDIVDLAFESSRKAGGGNCSNAYNYLINALYSVIYYWNGGKVKGAEVQAKAAAPKAHKKAGEIKQKIEEILADTKASLIPKEKGKTYREFDPATGQVKAVTYEIEEAKTNPAPNPELQHIMQMFDKFETLNFRVLALLNKDKKTIDDFYKLFRTMKEMVQVYLYLFKDQAMDKPLESIASDPTDLVGGRTIARIILGLEKISYQTLDTLKPVKTGKDLLPIGIEAVLQRFDGEKTTQLISKGAENYSQDEMNGISFAELINIVHQKGVRNLSTIIGNIHGQKQKVKVSVKTHGGAANIEIGYYDARQTIDSPTALPVKYVAQAFAKGELIHHQSRLFDPSQALILANEKRAIIGIPLGNHSARVQFSIQPIQEGGHVVVNYTDSGPAFSPGSDIRVKALAEAFKAVGFKVHQSGYAMDAYFDKDSGAVSIDELPEKLTFAIQALCSTKSVDLFIKANPELAADKDIVQKIAQELNSNGYLQRVWVAGNRGHVPGETVEVVTVSGKNIVALHYKNDVSYLYLQKNGTPQGMPEGLAEGIRKSATVFGMDLTLFPHIGQRLLDRVQEESDLFVSRGAWDDDSAAINASYEEASKASPAAYFLKHILSADEARLKSLREVAAVAKTVESFAYRRILGRVGKYNIEQLILPLLGDQVTFYVLKDSKDSSYCLAHAVLGEFFYDKPRMDRFRNKRMSNNELSVRDLEELMAPQNMISSEGMKEWIRQNIGTISQQKADELAEKSIFEIIKEGNLLNVLVKPFKIEVLFEASTKGQEISPVSFGGFPLNKGAAIGRAVINDGTKSPVNFDRGIFIAAYAEPKDDEAIKVSNGLVVTTGGVLSHAAIRSREFKKAGLILLGAEFTGKALKFKRFKGVEQRSEIAAGDKKLSYWELSDYGEEEYVVKDGDIVYIDAGKGIFFVIADSSDKAAQGVFNRYDVWKTGREELPVRDPEIQMLQEILSSISNENLVRAIINDLIYHSLIQASGLEKVLADLTKDHPEKKEMLVGFLREQAEMAIVEFQKKMAEYRKVIRESKKTDDIQLLFLMADDLTSQAGQLEQLIQLSNGNWQSDFTLDTLKETVREVISIGRDWLKICREKIIQEEVRSTERNLETITLLRLVRLMTKLNMAGLVAKDVSSVLFRQLEMLRLAREAEVKSKIGRGIIWKEDLLDRFSRPLAGGKGAHSGEIVKMIEALRGFLPINVIGPMGFVIQPEEFRLWQEKGQPGELDDELKRNLTLAYRDLIVKQRDELVSFIKEKDERTHDPIKKQLFQGLARLDSLKTLDASASVAIDSIIQLTRSYVYLILQSAPEDAISQSLRKRLEVFGSVAVRSSGLKEDSLEESKAGTKTTVLHVASIEDFCKAVIDVWRSSAEGVLVDEMINAKISGIAFSADPVNKRTDVIRINAGYGLAKGLVDHKVKNPDSYLVSKPTSKTPEYEIIEQEIGAKEEMETLLFDEETGAAKGTGISALHKDPLKAKQKQEAPVLKEEQVKAIAQAVDTFSKIFGHQVDVEWSIDSDDRLVILQVRPITTISESIERGRKLLIPESIDPRFRGDDSKGGEIVHAEAMEIKKDSSYYSEKSVVDEDRTSMIYHLTIAGKKISVVMDERLGMTDGEIGALIEEALARTKEASIATLPDTLTISVLEKSSHIFEDHLANGFIGINRMILIDPRFRGDDKARKAQKALLNMGIVHELTHELTGKTGYEFEKEQAERDVEYVIDQIGEESRVLEYLVGTLSEVLATAEFVERLEDASESRERKREAFIRDVAVCNKQLFSSIKKYLLKGEAVDIVIDSALIPAESLDKSMDVWAELILLCWNFEGVNFIFSTSGVELLKKKITEKAQSLDILEVSAQDINKRVNTEKRKDAIEVSIISRSTLEKNGEEEELAANQYPVVLDGPPVLGKDELEGLPNTFEAALTIGLANAALVTAQKRGDKEFSTLKKGLSDKLQRVYAMFRSDVGPDQINSKTLDAMITGSSKTRLRLALSLSLPPIAKVAYEQLQNIYNANRRLSLSA